MTALLRTMPWLTARAIPMPLRLSAIGHSLSDHHAVPPTNQSKLGWRNEQAWRIRSKEEGAREL